MHHPILGYHFRISMNRFYDINSNENTLLRDIKYILKSIYGYLKSLMISKNHVEIRISINQFFDTCIRDYGVPSILNMK